MNEPQSDGSYKVLVWQVRGTSRHLIPSKQKGLKAGKLKAHILESLKPLVPVLSDFTLDFVKNPAFSQSLLVRAFQYLT